jgi:hypothetical protein
MSFTRHHVVLDLDDFSPDRESNCLDWLFELKKKHRNFKVTLFTILGRWNVDLLRDVARMDWIELAAHGYKHINNDEAFEWTKQEWYDMLNRYEQTGIFVKGFKAPNWEMSPLGYQVLKDMGWWVAVRKSQLPEVLPGMRYYCFETNVFGAHGHTWTMAAHKQEGLLDWSSEADFDFVSSHIQTKK